MNSDDNTSPDTGFEEYQPRHGASRDRRRDRDPIVTIGRTLFTLNYPAVEALGCPERVALAWRADPPTMRITPVRPGERSPSSLKLSGAAREKPGLTGSVSSIGFARTYGVELFDSDAPVHVPAATGTCPAGTCLFVDLTDPVLNGDLRVEGLS